jgi:two-component system phosphate regulon sensor histidine kinase PhoR
LAIFGTRFGRGAAQQEQTATLAAVITEKERVEREAGALRREYDTLLEWCGVGALILDAGGVIIRANTTAMHLLSVTAPILVGKTLLEATLSEEMDALYRQARLGRGVRDREVRGPLPNGSSLIVSITPLPAHEASHEAPGDPRYLLVAQDVTELRRLETVRRDFVANVSHELRTPLASIRLMAETLQEGALSDPSVAQRFLGTIVTETDRLARIAQDLLVLSDAESRQPERERFNLTLLTEEVVNRYRPQAEKAQVRLTASVEAGIEVEANHDQIEQVLVNLLDNAIKYTPAGGSAHVTAVRDARQECATIHVRDTGIGILSEDLPRIFERFYRVDKARSRQSGGTGLGLSIVKHIIEAHGGTVVVDSEYNHGSTFTFTLPA